jgi:hypothetical protein
MTFLNIVGIILVATPFVVVTIFGIKATGWKVVLLTYGIVATVVALIWGGCSLAGL